MGGARPVSVGLFLGLTVTSIGGPLALLALYIPQALDGAGSSAGLSTLMATLVFLFPLAVWYRYSESIGRPGACTPSSRRQRVRRLPASRPRSGSSVISCISST